MNYTLVQEQRIGMRESNQDYAIHDATGEALLLAVADGMGGYHGGELAAEIAAGSVCHSFGREARPRLAAPDVFLEQAIARAHAAIRRYTDEQALPEGPRTVIVACVVQDGRAWWNHVGDARLYLARQGRIEPQTRDHTPVQALVDAGEISPEDAYRHPESNRVLQSLGAPTAPEPGPGGSVQLQKDDILLLCSDGFWGPLRRSQLLAGLEAKTLKRAVLALADTAERRAGANGDNLTVLALRWLGETATTAEQAEHAAGSDDATARPARQSSSASS